MSAASDTLPAGRPGALLFIRSALFLLLLLVITPPYAILVLLAAPLPRMPRHRFIIGWTVIVMWLVRHLLGIRHVVKGAEHLPRRPAIILSKHQSAWETIAFQTIFPPQSFLLKRELLWIPFLGWGLALFSPIAIDRASRSEAFRRLGEQGRKRLSQGFWITVFPEGTRTAPGRRGRYRVGGAWLAHATGTPVVPVAHNAGLVWPRNAFIKRPGVVTVEIGEPIDPAGLSAEQLNARVEQWIETRMAALCPA
jgi:1-acyl-sn-glycerol-3-phosphate acyltransferase